ncbi:bifunctional NADH dehydrogenase FAD-containing subunit/selenide, water dikinase SelD, partial [bacterium]|nr:bifunctional NADH dehydrogenase FAD-containing subunit/selenide, water dikinase SelD [bacterium]
IWRKGGAKAGDVFVLTKPIGTGALLYASMRGQLSGQIMEELWAHLLQSQRKAFSFLESSSIHAATDVTGFGLGGHLAEMCEPDGLTIEIDGENLPLLTGFREVLSKGFETSLSLSNASRIRPLFNGSKCSNELLRLLSDPQTNGGLLVALPEKEASSLVKELHGEGYSGAQIIGHVVSSGSHQGPLFKTSQ